MNNHVTLKIRGLTDEKDSSYIKNHIDDLSGVSKVDVDLDDGTVAIDYNSQSINPATIISKIEKWGYDVNSNATKLQN